MNQKSSLREVPQFVSGVLTGNKLADFRGPLPMLDIVRHRKRRRPYGRRREIPRLRFANRWSVSEFDFDLTLKIGCTKDGVFG
jgi:hypothetical protein